MIDFDRLVLASCEDVFGRDVTYITKDGRYIPARGVYNDRFAEEKYDNDQALHTSHPMLSVRASRLPKMPEQTEFFYVGDALLVVTAVDPDGMGDLRIHLRAATDDQARRIRLSRA